MLTRCCECVLLCSYTRLHRYIHIYTHTYTHIPSNKLNLFLQGKSDILSNKKVNTFLNRFMLWKSILKTYAWKWFYHSDFVTKNSMSITYENTHLFLILKLAREYSNLFNDVSKRFNGCWAHLLKIWKCYIFNLISKNSWLPSEKIFTSQILTKHFYIVCV